ncbi:GcrA family cell cycle regulator [Bartonella sp. TP]|uniref:GcrA family cell cycle regulator n=1 Tax=Bartonella sp. TP TaxID=3057550 RepID=UPI0025AF348C|nr:GcrA family cell cycle regulator [Bartonella sp. TP]WJW80425.1 GcrA family cell cycle regulator [Bartonella sp. TP]
MVWTPAQIKHLRELWGSGLTAQQIASILGIISRNAVIGKANRMKLSKLDKQTSLGANMPQNELEIEPAKKSLVSRAAAKNKTTALDGFQESVKQLEKAASNLAQAAGEAPEEEGQAPEPLKLTLLELNEYKCKWPVEASDEGEFYFCGHSADKASSYCPYHAKLAFHPNQLKRRKTI